MYPYVARGVTPNSDHPLGSPKYRTRTGTRTRTQSALSDENYNTAPHRTARA